MRYENLILFVLLSVAWGTAFNAIKIGLNYFPPVIFASFRYLLAGLIMLIYAFSVKDKFFPTGKDEFLQIFFAAFFMIALYHTFLFIGEIKVESGIASIIVSLSPVLTTGFARILLPNERLNKIGLIGLFLGFVGIMLLLSPKISNLMSIELSRILIFSAAAAFAIGSVLIRVFESNFPIESMEAWSMLLGALIMLSFSIILDESIFSLTYNINGLLALAYLSIISSSIGFLIYFNLLHDLGPIEVNLVSYSAPIVATAVGVIWLNEILTQKAIISLLVIFLGFYLLKRDKIKEEFNKINFK